VKIKNKPLFLWLLTVEKTETNSVVVYMRYIYIFVLLIFIPMRLKHSVGLNLCLGCRGLRCIFICKVSEIKLKSWC
jgi:hypothetical protein